MVGAVSSDDIPTIAILCPIQTNQNRTKIYLPLQTSTSWRLMIESPVESGGREGLNDKARQVVASRRLQLHVGTVAVAAAEVLFCGLRGRQ